jgi:hypothetical protein
MGRYYSGDISGKFWFAVQSSDCADRFGVTGETPNVLNYYFSEENLEDVEEEIQNIEEALGDKVRIIDEFFASRESYNDEALEEAGISKHELSEYADLQLGKKIRDCIKEDGQCEFEAEC